MKKMKRATRSALSVSTFAMIAICCCLTVSAIVAAATFYVPVERADGNPASTVSPIVSGHGQKAEVLTPEVILPEVDGDEPFEPFIPSLKDDEPFVDMESSRDFSKQYDYTDAVLYSYNGSCTVEDGVYTAETASSIYANMDASTPLPYGIISADIVNNGGDTGLVFGLSANKTTFWEGAGINYYFAFVSQSGTLYLGRTREGAWSALAYATISGYSASTTYNVQVVNRIDKIVIFLDGVPMISYRVSEPLTGTGWGIRTGAVGAKVSNLTVTSKVTVD